MSDQNICFAALGPHRCFVPRSNKRHMEVPERHASNYTQWDDDAPGAIPHPVSREVEHYRNVVASLRAHLVLGCRDKNDECIACAAEGFPGIPYPCSTLIQARGGAPASDQ